MRAALRATTTATAILMGCGEAPTALPPDDTPPVACLGLGITNRTSDCPYTFLMLVDPRCSSDDRSSRSEMKVRYDYDNNGTWDTDYLPLEVNADYSPAIVSNPIWTARCEVRDGAGNAAQAVASMDLSASDRVPNYPDIIAGRIEAPDTVGVGEPFSVLIAERCWIDSSSTHFKTEMYLDDVLWDEAWGQSWPNVGRCTGHGRDGLSIPTAGPHEITVLLEAEDVIEETDETNNSSRHTIVVVSSRASALDGSEIAYGVHAVTLDKAMKGP